MSTNITDIIEKKRDGVTLNNDEIKSFVQGVTDDSWQDYQISAMLMAMFICGLNDEETAALTLHMAASGEQMDLSVFGGKTADKHSTGGVADTTTLIAVPMAAACGVPVLKMSGRGLGFTGGTIDKLESIPGFNVNLNSKQAIEQVQKHGLAVMAQSDNLTPADKKLYALRDVTATVDSIPLIAASIMSKKIAAGASSIILDVKCGSGAFMHNINDARKLADTMVRIGNNTGRKTAAIISSMDQPLGSHIGNSLEVIEAIDVLKGKTSGDLLAVSVELAARMLILTGQSSDMTDAVKKLMQSLESGNALAKLAELIEIQGGNPNIIDNNRLLPQPDTIVELLADRSGYLTKFDTAQIGKAFVAAGGGRVKKSDSIDYSAGIIMDVRLGSKIEKGTRLARIQAENKTKVQKARDILGEALTIGDDKPEEQPVIIDRVGL